MGDKTIVYLNTVCGKSELIPEEINFINKSIDFLNLESIFFEKLDSFHNLEQYEDISSVAKELNEKQIPLIYMTNFIVDDLKQKTGYMPKNIPTLKERILYCSCLFLLKHLSLTDEIDKRFLDIVSKNVGGILVPKKHFLTLVSQYNLVLAITKRDSLEGFEKYLKLRSAIIDRTDENVFDRITNNDILCQNIFNIVCGDISIDDGDFLSKLKEGAEEDENAKYLISLFRQKKLKKELL